MDKNWSQILTKMLEYAKAAKSIFINAGNSESDYENLMTIIRRDMDQFSANLLDLEGISEALSSLVAKVWTIAIAQEKLDDVINNST